DLATRGRPELGLEVAAEAPQRRGRQDRLARPADADRQVVVGAADRGRDRRGDVAVLDQLDAGAGGPELLDEAGVPRPVEDDRRYVVRPPPERRGDCLDVLGDRPAEVDAAAGARA